MGAIASVFEAMCKKPSDDCQQPWPSDVDDRRNLVVTTRRILGLDWAYKMNCGIADHNVRRTTSDQIASYRDATVITLPDRPSSTFAKHVTDFLESEEASDLSIRGLSPCPFCADDLSLSMCHWQLLPFRAPEAPDRVFFRSARVFRGEGSLPPTPSMTLTLGDVDYVLVGVSYHVAVGSSAERNHFVSQFKCSGAWFKYDCMQGGSTSSSSEFDPLFHAFSVYMLAYIKKSLCRVASTAYEDPPDSPSSRFALLEGGVYPSFEHDEPDSPCTRNGAW